MRPDLPGGLTPWQWDLPPGHQVGAGASPTGDLCQRLTQATPKPPSPVTPPFRHSSCGKLPRRWATQYTESARGSQADVQGTHSASVFQEVPGSLFLQPVKVLLNDNAYYLVSQPLLPVQYNLQAC